MTEERLKEIKDSIDFQLDIAKINKLDGVINCLIEEQELYDEVINLQQENERLKKELNKHIKEGIEKDQEIERLNNIIEKTESMLKRLMEEQEYCYKKYPENWEERTGVSNTWLTSRDCYWSALNYLIKLKGNDKE